MVKTFRILVRAGLFAAGLWFASAAALLPVAACLAGNRDSAFLNALHSITQSDLCNHGATLASDELEGREAGTPGNKAAAEYIVSVFQRCGLQPAGTDGYYQPFDDSFHNLVAELSGSDPEKQNEFIVLGAHFDHVGYGSKRNVRDKPGNVHNGADDNASGTSALLEIAQAFTLLPQPPRRSLLFIFFDAEEKGLLGSKYWVAHATRPIDCVKFMINLDMVGRLRLDRVELYGWRTSPGIRPLVSRCNSSAGFDIEFSWMNRFDSDHAPFFLRSIPVLLFHTGLHEDYHKSTDDIEKLNLEGMERIARWVFDVTFELANADTIPSFRQEVAEESETRRREILGSPPKWRDRLGLVVERHLPSQDGSGSAVLKVSKVLFNSPAAEAGIEPGDWILAVNGQAINEPEQFQAVTLLSPAEEIRLTVRPHFGEKPAVEKAVKLEGPPIRLGIQWTKDEAVPQAVMITHVLKGSPADLAGLSPGDYIYAVDGEAIDPDRFETIIQDSQEPLQLEIEHRGKIRTINIPERNTGTTMRRWTSRLPVLIPNGAEYVRSLPATAAVFFGTVGTSA